MATEGRVVLVAGGTGGIGEAVVRALAAAGHRVFIGYGRGEATAARIAAEVAAGGGDATPIALNVRDSAAVDAACRTIFQQSGRLDVLVDCAAVNREAPAAGMDDESWHEVVDVNLSGAFRLCRAVARYMVPRRWGRIITLSSISAARGGRGQINYSASKAGVEALTRVLALELGRKGVLVNCVAPGVIETSMSERVRAERQEELLQGVALRRFGKPEEIAGVVRFLVSDESSYITGQVIRVDGGMVL